MANIHPHIEILIINKGELMGKVKYTEKERNSIFNAIIELQHAHEVINAIMVYLLTENPDLTKGFKSKIKKYTLDSVLKKREKTDEFVKDIFEKLKALGDEARNRDADQTAKALEDKEVK